MTSVSPLSNVLVKGLYGDHEGKKEDDLIKIKEIKNLLIVQIVQYKNSSSQIKDIQIDGLNISSEALKVSLSMVSSFIFKEVFLYCAIWTINNFVISLILTISLSFFPSLSPKRPFFIISFRGDIDVMILLFLLLDQHNEMKQFQQVLFYFLMVT